MGLPIRIETRTGDTPTSKRQRQRRDPPDILLTTPEQLALLLASADAPYLFGSLKRVVLDELHALVTSKRGDLLSLGLARLFRLAPGLATTGLSATVAEPEDLCRFLVPQPEGGTRRADLVVADGGAEPHVTMLEPGEDLPWAGHSARHAFPQIYELIKRHKMTLVFVNTRSQAEMIFHALWHINEDSLAIALHHGSLDVAQRRKVEDAMTAGRLRAVVCTSSLDLGVDWGDIDLVINVGAPKGASRLLQRIGRANHRLDEPSRGILVPANRFEVLECNAAIGAVADHAQDTPPLRTGALDVLAQHVLGTRLRRAVRRRRALSRGEDRRALQRACARRLRRRGRFRRHRRLCAQGLRALRQDPADQGRPLARSPSDGGAALPHECRHHRRGRHAEGAPGALARRRRRPHRADRARRPRARRGRGIFHRDAGAGRHLRVRRRNPEIRGAGRGRGLCLAHHRGPIPRCRPTRAASSRSRPISPTACAACWPSRSNGRRCPSTVREWLRIQQWRSLVPGQRDLLVETFPRADKYYLVCYPFEGRLAHQTLGMLLTRRLERARLKPLGFVANEYALAVWGLGDVALRIQRGELSLAALFDEDMLGDDLEAWLAESALMKRTFRTCAIIAGLIERRFPGEEKSRRQVTISTDLVYDVLRKHQGDHVLLRAARADAATGLLDIRRLGEMLSRIRGRIVHKALDRVSPLAVPVMLEIGRETVYGEASEAVMAEAAEDLIKEAMG